MVMVIKMSKVKPGDSTKQENTACECGCGLDELKSIIQGEVSVYKAIWDEVERQFADAPAETRIKIYSSIAPYIGDMVTLTATECIGEEEDRKRKKNKKKK
jgi:hypothetical protein